MYKVMSWKSKLFDELASRSVFLSLVFLAPLFFVKLTPENAKAYIALATVSLGTGIAKTVQNAIKAKASSVYLDKKHALEKERQ